MISPEKKPEPQSPVLNPYVHLARQVRALLRVEEDFGPDERKKSSWMIQVEFLGKKIVVGKGGANTIFYTFGKGKRQICYPDSILKILDKLARQQYVLYRVGSKAEGGVTKFDRDHALAVEPRPGAEIIGVDAKGSKRTVFRAKKDLAGKLKWIKV